MLKHVLLWKFNSAVMDDEKDNLIEAVKLSGFTMAKNIKELESVEVYKILNNDEYDFIYTAVIKDTDDLKTYQNSSLHMAHKERFSKFLTKPTVFDYKF